MRVSWRGFVSGQFHMVRCIAFLWLFLGSFAFVLADETNPWIVYYSDEAPTQSFSDYQVIVFSRTAHPNFTLLDDGNRQFFGYLSLAEVAEHRHYFSRVSHLLLGENPNWPGSYYLDLRDPLWTSIVIEELIPAILHQGFHGLFLDTLDDPPYLEETRPADCAGLKQAAVHLVKAIRHHYPQIPLMVNRGYVLLPDIGKEIDMVVGESVYADYDFETKQYALVPKELYQQQKEILLSTRKQFPDVEIFTLDYWDPQDKQGIARIYREQRKNGFRPYVATIDLDEIIEEPQ